MEDKKKYIHYYKMEWELELTEGTILFVVVLVGILFNPFTYKIMGKLLGKLLKTKYVPKEYILFMIHTLLFALVLFGAPLLNDLIQMNQGPRTETELEEELEELEEEDEEEEEEELGN